MNKFMGNLHLKKGSQTIEPLLVFQQLKMREKIESNWYLDNLSGLAT